MFQFSGFASRMTGSRGRPRWVAPFGNLRINGYLHLPTAYRSLSRPSSPLRAKASSVRPFLLSYPKAAIPGLSQLAPLHPFESRFQRLSYSFRFFQHVNELVHKDWWRSRESNPSLFVYCRQATPVKDFVVPPRFELGTSTLSV